MYDIVIIGAGTAGLSAAIYGCRAGKKVLLLEAGAYGGQIITSPSVENYPGIKQISGYEFAVGLFEQAVECGAQITFESVQSVKAMQNYFIAATPTQEIKAKTLIIAAGTKNRQLGLPREQALLGKGLSYCATCDGAFFKGKTVAVAGGGNTALEDALFLSAYCKKVYLIHRRETFRGDQRQVSLLQKKDNVVFLLNRTVTGLTGKTKLQQITVTETADGKKSKLTVAGLFIAIGQKPQNDMFSSIVALDESGYIVADETCNTNVPGVFAAGDCRTKQVRQLATAASDGACAALAACKFIEGAF